MKILEACKLFCKLAVVFYGINADVLKPQITSSVKEAIKSASGKFSKNFFPELGKTIDSVSFDLTVNSPTVDPLANYKEVLVSNFVVMPQDKQELYNTFPAELQSYLQTNNALFPSRKDNEDIKYVNFITTITYP